MERKELSLKQLAADACGLSAFRWAQKRYGLLHGVQEVVKAIAMPVESKFLRESIGLSKGRVRLLEANRGCAAMVRDGLTVGLAFGTLVAVTRITNNPSLGLAAFFASKLVLNGIVHLEMYKFSQK